MSVIDAHAHLETRMLELKVMLHEMDNHGVDQTVLIPSMNDPLPKTPKKLLSLMRRLMNSPLNPLARRINELYMTKEGNLKLQGTVFEIYAEPDNQSVADAISAHPDRFLGWIFLNPRAPVDPLEVLERYRTIEGFVGVKVHPHWHQYPVTQLLPIARRCEELNIPMLIHLGFGPGSDFKILTDACPKLRILIAHAGFPTYGKIWEQIHEIPSVWIDVSSPYLDEALVRKAAAALGPERIVYGTDAPYGFETHHSGCFGDMEVYDYGHIRGWVERLPFKGPDIDRILGKNVHTLLDRQLANSKPSKSSTNQAARPNGGTL